MRLAAVILATLAPMGAAASTADGSSYWESVIGRASLMGMQPCLVASMDSAKALRGEESRYQLWADLAYHLSQDAPERAQERMHAATTAVCEWRMQKGATMGARW